MAHFAQKGAERFSDVGADGKCIYFISNWAGKPRVLKMKVDGEADQITKGSARLTTPAPDSKTVYFIKEEFIKEMWCAPVRGGAEEIIPEFPAYSPINRLCQPFCTSSTVRAPSR